MDKAVLDTDTFSELIKGRNPTVAHNARVYLRSHPNITVTVVTVMEIVKGLHKVGREAQIQSVLGRLATEEVLDLDPRAAEGAARIHADLERTGQPIGWSDTVIAAIAIRHDLELVTGNTSHYERIVRLGYPLRLSNWRI